MLTVKDSQQQRLLHVNGFFTDKFLPETTVDALMEMYHAHFDDKNTSFYSTSFHPDLSLKQQVTREVLALLQPILDGKFADYKILGTSFLKKNPEENNPLPLQQDWTVTDEDKYGSFTIWIPLQDTTPYNGAIRVISGSHCVENNFRAPSLPVAFEQDRAKMDEYLTTLPLKKGEAFVFNQKLMHASWPNQSKEERIALTIGLVPKEADLFMLYYDAKNKMLHRYSMPDDLFLRYPEIIQQPTIGILEDSFPYQPGKFTEQQFRQKLYENRMKNTAMQPLFSNTEHQQFFEQNGYIKLPALQEDDIRELTDFLYQSGIKKVTDYGFYVGMDHEDKELVARMMQKVEQVAMPRVSPYLKDYQLITASYVIKDPNPVGVVPPHQDWTFVEDETQHCSVTCWIALVDTDMQNGCMGVIKGSNRFFSSVRPSPSPQVPTPLGKHMFSLFPYFELLPMKAGEALIFDNRTFHASPPNITQQPRLAVGLSFTQKEAQLRHYYLKPGTKDTLLKYEIDPAFFMKYDNGTLSRMFNEGKVIEDYPCAGEQKFVWEDLSKDEMKQRVLAAGNVYNKELTAHMMKLFGNQMKDGLKDKVMGMLTAINPLNVIRKVKEKMQ